MAMLPKFSLRFNKITMKIPTGTLFLETDKLILRFIWKFKESRIAKEILMKYIVGGLSLLDFSTYYKVLVIKTHVVLEERQTQEENKESGNEPMLYGQLILGGDFLFIVYFFS